MKFKNSISFFLILFLIASSQSSNAQTCTSSQDRLQSNMDNLVHAFLKDLDNNDNAVRKIQLYKKWASDMNEILCIKPNIILHFEGLVWSVDFDNETDDFILRIGIMQDDVRFPIFYNYRFNESSPLIDALSALNPRDRVRFDFKFHDTFYPDEVGSENYFEFRGIPAEKNPDTDNLGYFFFIDLIYIDIIKDIEK